MPLWINIMMNMGFACDFAALIYLVITSWPFLTGRARTLG